MAGIAGLAKPGRKDNDVADARFAALAQDRRHRLARRRDDGEIDFALGGGDRGKARLAEHRVVFRIDGDQVAFETAVHEVGEDLGANGIA